MTLGTYLQQQTAELIKAGIDSARLDCLILLEDSIGKDRAWILAHPEYLLQAAELEKLNAAMQQRQQHIPLAYIRNRVEFYGRNFFVDQRVLTPRPESEAIITLAKQIPLSKPIIVDVGTGSGILAITSALEIPHATVFATDISSDCLTVAQHNAERLHARIIPLQCSLLQHSQITKANLILANLPYVPTTLEINHAARHEPAQALYGGTDGLDLFRELFQQLTYWRTSPEHIITESLESQHTSLAVIARQAGYQLHATDGLAQHFTCSV